MEAGRELDALIAERVMQEPPRLSWELLSPDGHATAFTAETKKEVEDWQAYYNLRYPNNWMADYHVGTWKHYPRYSTDIAEAWQVVERLAIDHHWAVISRSGPQSDHWQVQAEFSLFGSMDLFREIADTAPLAICLAALKAIEK